MKALLLARVSTDDQTTEQQLPRLISYAKDHNLEYTDKDIYDFSESAYKDDRKEFQKMLERITNEPETIAVVTDKIDRLIRAYFQHFPAIDKLRKDGKVELHFPSDNLVLTASSPAIDLFKFTIGIALAQYYSDTIRDNVKRKFDQKVRNGELLTKAPFGYRNIPLDEKINTVIVEPKETKIVQRMYELYATKSYSDRTLKKQIYNEFNVKIAPSKIARILQNKFYIGFCFYKKKNLEYPHIYEKIVSENIFKEVQKIRDERIDKMNRGKHLGKDFFYRALVRCDVCGKSMSPEEHRGKAYYCCTESSYKHSAKYVSEEIFNLQFKEAFNRISLSNENIEKIMADLKALNSDNLAISTSRMENLVNEQARLKRMKSNNYDNYVDGSITKELYDEKQKEYDERLQEVTQSINASEQVDNSFYITAKYILELAKHSGELFEQANMLERRTLINTVLTNIKWNGEKLVYDYIKPFNLLVNFQNNLNGVEDGT